MRGRTDLAWRRYYNVVDRAMILLQEGKISRGLYTIIHEQARRRAYQEQT
jgi:hypothetical protein